MSLSLIQSYSSDEEEEKHHHNYDSFSVDDEDNDSNLSDDDVSKKIHMHKPTSYKPVIPPSSATPGSTLPSALDVFSEITGPPRFLNHTVEDEKESVEKWQGGRYRKRNRDKKDLPAGAVMESKAHLVGIHERVRSDMEGSQKGASTTGTASQPSLCLQCGIPKIRSSALGVVCPVCPSEDSKKKGSAVKDKEKIKRMRGQSSHATWKSETEMQLRQTFD